MTTAQPDSLFDRPFRSALEPIPRAWTTAVFVAIAYYLGAKLGFALTLRPIPISTLWPPNTILLAALLLTPRSWWWIVLVAALPAHLAVELKSGFPTQLVLAWYVSNCSEALIGASLVRALLPVRHQLRFDRSAMSAFSFFAARSWQRFSRPSSMSVSCASPVSAKATTGRSGAPASCPMP